jgi:hypothetical protein
MAMLARAASAQHVHEFVRWDLLDWGLGSF